MDAFSIHQAVYGYERGHRLLASSTPIEGPAGRLLRVITDMAFDGRSAHYLTVTPLPEMRAQAVIRTWPAGGDVRAGSVWSHVLLIDFVDLGRLDALSRIAKLFRHPEEVGVAYFSNTARLGGDQTLTSIGAKLDPALAIRLLSAAYGGSEEETVGWDAPEDAETTLLRIWEQQWPRLRRSFSFRTRRRPADGAGVRFALEVVERPSRGSSESSPTVSPWLEVLLRDLEFPSSEFRRRLKTYGIDSAARSDVPVLVDVLRDLDLSATSPPAVVEQLARGFPAPTAMRTLKRALLGRVESVQADLIAWPQEEAVRLGLLPPEIVGIGFEVRSVRSRS